MMKKYQEKVVEDFREFLIKCMYHNSPKLAFFDMTNKNYNQIYGNVPFVCIKIPTGGGKTYVACNMIPRLYDIYLKDKLDKGIIIWFVPSDAIKSQTINKLKNKNDFHRKIFDEYFLNKIRIFSNEEALNIRKSDVENNICIIIASIDSFRKEKSIQNKYKVYQENGALLNFFENLDNFDKLEKDESGVINSLANVIRMNNPLIVIDEGHRAKTELSEDIVKDLNPSFIIEFTATPRVGSNILCEVSSLDLKQEKMVKIPIVLENISQWENAINRGVIKRNELEELSKKENEYIRPIVLLQAQSDKGKDNDVTVEKIKTFLITEKKIPEEQIAIKTSKFNQLENINLFSKSCKIRYIITINALAEGWDCSFAYILISVANLGSRVSVEQIIGRILRLPNVKEKKQEDLNRSYVFSSSKNFNEAADEVIKGLINNGYQKEDLISSNAPKKLSPYEVKKVVKQNFSMPLISLNGDLLQFSDLIGKDFILSKFKTNFDDFESFYDNDGRILIDIDEKSKWLRDRQTILKVTYSDKNFSELELLNWLDKKLRFIMLDREDKRKFVSNVIKYQLSKQSLSQLSINRFVFKEFLQLKINEIIEDYTKQIFEELYKKGKISIKSYENFPDIIEISNKINEKFKKNYYEELETINKEELDFIRRLDTEMLENLEFWIRIKEKGIFYLQGWKPNKFYPDFIALTKKGNILIIEWKGMDRISNDDTKYKAKLGELYESLGKGKVHFFLACLDNIEETLKKIKNL
ncbi:MAG: DEAD/DEAH box helicase family protein [Candidatus Nanoarchaeia archaeon]|jgi:superfamily II DNA or RNA helicase